MESVKGISGVHFRKQLAAWSQLRDSQVLLAVDRLQMTACCVKSVEVISGVACSRQLAAWSQLRESQVLLAVDTGCV